MKKVFSLVLCVIMICLCFSGCGTSAEMSEENIEKTVGTVTDALKDFDTGKLEKYVDSATLGKIIGYAQQHKQFRDLGKAIFENLEVKITKTDVEDKTVTLSVKNKDLYSVASNFTKNLKGSYSSIQLLNNLNDENFLDENLSALCKSIDDADMQDMPYIIKLTIKQGKKNLILSFDEKAENIISGGALLAVKDIYS